MSWIGPLPDPMPHENWLCGETHIQQHLIDSIPELGGRVFTAATVPTDQYGISCKDSPNAIVSYDQGEGGADAEFGGRAIFQTFEVWFGADIECTDGDVAREILGPLLSKVMGVHEVRATRETAAWPAVPGVLPGFIISPLHEPLQLVSAPRQELIPAHKLLYFATRWRAFMHIPGTQDNP